MPKIYLTVNDETGQHRGYCTQHRIPEILTLAGAPLPCYPVEDNRTLRVRLGTQYIPIAVYEHPGKGPEDAACLSIEQTARVPGDQPPARFRLGARIDLPSPTAGDVGGRASLHRPGPRALSFPVECADRNANGR